MLQISGIKLQIKHTEEELLQMIYKNLRISSNQLQSYEIIKCSLDARKKNEIRYIYSIAAKVLDETRVLRCCKNANVSPFQQQVYHYTISKEMKMKQQPIVVGSGPAGLFCAYYLAKAGYQPILIEQGEPIEARMKSVEEFWNTGILKEESNVQFGEGGAGTFSDGKLNTMVKDPSGRIKEVLKTFVRFGAPENIVYHYKPHIGTDLLRSVIRNMREEIKHLGGVIHFQTKLVDFIIQKNRISGIVVRESVSIKEEQRILPCDTLILAIGHSARDTFELLYRRGFFLEQKAFAVGVRIEHKQDMIGEAQYGHAYKDLPAADYKLTHQCRNKRGVYSFCMCPGGYVVNASSEEKHLVVNGMSYHDRAGENANSAIVVTVTPEDFIRTPGIHNSPLAGMEFQRYYEALAYQTGKKSVPIQLFGDLLRGKESVTIGSIKPNSKGSYVLSDLSKCLPDFILESIIEGIQGFDQKLPGFANEEAILSGVEMRTSSPIRITRNDDFQCSVKGVYPCGEGAGYAGGIVSAAVDGLKVFEHIICSRQDC